MVIPARSGLGWTPRLGTLAAITVFAFVGCSQRSYTGNPTLVNPDDVSAESGSTEEIYEVSEETVNALLGCGGIDASEKRSVAIDSIVNQTGLRDYDENVLANRLLSDLVSKAGSRFTFFERDAADRADVLVRIELRNLRGAETRTIQYSVKFVSREGQLLCSSVREIKKRT